RIPPGDPRRGFEEGGRLGFPALLREVGETSTGTFLRAALVVDVRLHHPAGARGHVDRLVRSAERVVDRRQLDETVATIHGADRWLRLVDSALVAVMVDHVDQECGHGAS